MLSNRVPRIASATCSPFTSRDGALHPSRALSLPPERNSARRAIGVPPSMQLGGRRRSDRRLLTLSRVVASDPQGACQITGIDDEREPPRVSSARLRFATRHLPRSWAPVVGYRPWQTDTGRSNDTISIPSTIAMWDVLWITTVIPSARKTSAQTLAPVQRLRSLPGQSGIPGSSCLCARRLGGPPR
jgi:hypothetical protein